MTHAGHSHPTGHAAPAGAVPFPPAEIDALHHEDRRAAAYIFLLMVGIFTLGLSMYLVIAFWVGG